MFDIALNTPLTKVSLAMPISVSQLLKCLKFDVQIDLEITNNLVSNQSKLLALITIADLVTFTEKILKTPFLCSKRTSVK